MSIKRMKVKPSEVGFGKYKNKTFTWVAKNDLEFFKQIKDLFFSQYNENKKSLYRKVEKRFLQNEGLIITEKYEDEVFEIANFLRQKFTSEEIRQRLSIEFKHISHHLFNSLISQANSIVKREFEQEKSYLLDIHLVRYEQIYQQNFKPDLEYVPPQYRKAVMCEHHITAMETLFQKEKLLGVHTKKFKLQANKSVFQRTDTDFDFTKLSSKERLEVLRLLEKSKIKLELVRPSIAEDQIDSISLSIEEKVLNESPIKQAIQTDIRAENSLLEQQSKGKALFEVQETIKKTLEQQVKDLFEKKNKK